MDSIRIIEGQARYAVAAVVLLIATIAAALVPAIVSAAQITERSIALSNSSAAMAGVQYDIEFNATAAADAVVVQFCDNTPLIGQACDAPAGLDTTGVNVVSSTATAVSSEALNEVLVTKDIAGAGTVKITLGGIENPAAEGVFYARIVTYDTTTNAGNYVATLNVESATGVVDYGSVALSITDTVGIAGAVLETLQFCVSGLAVGDLAADCANAATEAPVLRLGKETSPGSGVYALDASEISEGTISTQISTNAVSGAVVRLQSNAPNCGGLVRAGAPTSCDIKPAPLTAGSFIAGQALFGMKVASAVNPANATSPTGAFQVASGASYDNVDFKFNYDATNTNATGVTSVYGDPVLDTNGAPANNKNATLTFGASISNDTPAGLYSTDLSLIATGKF